MIKRLTVLAAIGGAAIAAIALLAEPAGASTPSNGNDSGVGCFVVDSAGMQDECAEISMTGSVSAGVAHATASFLPETSSKVLRTQIDNLAIELGPSPEAGGLVGGSGPVTGGQPHQTLQASTSAPVYATGTPPCGQRYRVYLTYSARFADGSLHKGRYRGPWFDSADGPCASATHLSINQTSHCMVHEPDGSVSACMLQRVDLLVSNDGHSLYGHGLLSVDGTSDAIARVQIDRVVLGSQHGGIAFTPGPASSGNTVKPYEADLASADSETAGAQWRPCGTQYTVAMYYSVRYTNGNLYQGRWATKPFVHC